MLKTFDTTDRHFIYEHNKNTNPVKYLMTYDLEPINMSFKAMQIVDICIYFRSFTKKIHSGMLSTP